MLRIHDILVWIRIRRFMTLTNESGSGPCYFRHWSSRCQQKTNFFKNIFCLSLFKGTFTSFSKIKSQKESRNIRNQGFSYYFCMMIEGFGSRRPKHIQIRRIRIRIRIRNSGSGALFFLCCSGRYRCCYVISFQYYYISLFSVLHRGLDTSRHVNGVSCIIKITAFSKTVKLCGRRFEVSF